MEASYAPHGLLPMQAAALANKLARICYATLRDHKPFDEAARLGRKESRQSVAMPN